MLVDKKPDVCVVGLGYIGLPTAAVIARSGCRVVGVDVNQSVVDTINRGEIHIEEVDLDGLVREDDSSAFRPVEHTSTEQCSDVAVDGLDVPIHTPRGLAEFATQGKDQAARWTIWSKAARCGSSAVATKRAGA